MLQRGAGHLEGSSLPVGGADTHACISAHRGLVRQKMFTNLDELDKGDIFLIHVLDEALYYRVDEIQTVLPDKVEPLEIKKGEDKMTPITCTPYGINTHRLYVTGHRISYSEEVERELTDEVGELRWKEWLWVPLDVVLLAVMCVVIWQYRRYR